MELVAAILLAGPLGYFCRTRTKGLGIYLLVAAVIFPIQTISVHADSPDDINAGYFVLNVMFLAVGVGLNVLGARLRRRRSRGMTSVTPGRPDHDPRL
ncbi:MAG: hypothetical protein M3417_09760 [Actinomycetota bacterium]|nr:hypothetical protein [Actinomycetota bacterium]